MFLQQRFSKSNFFDFMSALLPMALFCVGGAMIGAMLYALPYAFGMAWQTQRFLALTGVGAGCGGALLLMIGLFTPTITSEECARIIYAYVGIMIAVIAAVVGLPRLLG